jgi:hypothetical protein
MKIFLKTLHELRCNSDLGASNFPAGQPGTFWGQTRFAAPVTRLSRLSQIWIRQLPSCAWDDRLLLPHLSWFWFLVLVFFFGWMRDGHWAPPDSKISKEALCLRDLLLIFCNLLRSIPCLGDVERAGVATVGAEENVPTHATAVVFLFSFSVAHANPPLKWKWDKSRLRSRKVVAGNYVLGFVTGGLM